MEAPWVSPWRRGSSAPTRWVCASGVKRTDRE
jgi:hypothetical protein